MTEKCFKNSNLNFKVLWILMVLLVSYRYDSDSLGEILVLQTVLSLIFFMVCSHWTNTFVLDENSFKIKNDWRFWNSRTIKYLELEGVELKGNGSPDAFRFFLNFSNGDQKKIATNFNSKQAEELIKELKNRIANA